MATDNKKPVKYKLRKEDEVVVIAGKDKGTKSKIIALDKLNGKVVVENVNVAKRHTKQNQNNPDGGIFDKNMPLDISNVMFHCKKCDKPVRLGVKVLENGKKVRFCKKCNEVVDNK